EPKHELADLAADRRAAAPTRVCPAASDHAAMPAQQRRRRDQKRLPARAWQYPTRRGKEDPIGRRQLWPTGLPTKNRQLMAKHDDLELLEPLRARPEHDELKQAAQRQTAERPEQSLTPR